MGEEAPASVGEQWSIYERLLHGASKAIQGQREILELLCVALVAEGHVLLEGVPGTGKTLMAKVLAGLVDVGFNRIQFTPDLMPSDVVGTTVFDLASNRFFLKRGPVFTNVLLADEINRAPAKTQSALLEAMEERQVTIDGESHQLDFPFLVLATQNPVEYEGTYPLPEAQLDRFLFKLLVPYPGRQSEHDLLRAYTAGFDARDLASIGLQAVTNAPELRNLRSAAMAITVDDSILGYILSIVEETRTSGDLTLGAGPRASIALLVAARALAMLRGRSYVVPDDVKVLAPPVLRHRIMLRAEAEIEGVTADEVIARSLARVEVPR